MKVKIIRTLTLSAKEVELLNRLEYEGKDIYTRNEIISFCADREKADYLIRKLLKKGRLKTIIRNIYLFVPMKAPRGVWAGNEYLVAKALARGACYYIGYSAVFNSYGFTDQVAQAMHVINDRYSMRKTVFGVRYKLIKVLPNRLYGLETRKIENEDVVFPKKERAMIDAFEFYSVRKAYSILSDQISELDTPLLVDYLTQYPVLGVRRRVGYFLEKLRVNRNLLSKIKVGEKGYSPLYDTGSNQGKINNRWRIVING